MKRYGLDIWFDTESLKVGQLWENAILDAIEESDYFIAVLSSNSMTKKGYVQKELKTALNVIDLLPEDTTYILPVRIDDCLVKNRKLKRHQWVDIFPDSEYQNGLKKILKVVSPRTMILRSKQMDLTVINVHDMIRKHDFFDMFKNLLSKGFPHEYREMNIKGAKVIIDEFSCLMWQQSGSSERIFSEDANKWITKLNRYGFASFDNWRLPTLEEAMSLMESKQDNGLFINPIFDMNQRWLWTADLMQGTSLRWFVNFEDGECRNSSLTSAFIRAVRSEQSSKK